MVITGSILALIGALYPLIFRCTAFATLAPGEIGILIAAFLSFLCLFIHRHPSLGVLIASISIYELCKEPYEIQTAASLVLTVFGALLIILRSHRLWIEKKQAVYEGTWKKGGKRK